VHVRNKQPRSPKVPDRGYYVDSHEGVKSWRRPMKVDGAGTILQLAGIHGDYFFCPKRSWGGDAQVEDVKILHGWS